MQERDACAEVGETDDLRCGAVGPVVVVVAQGERDPARAVAGVEEGPRLAGPAGHELALRADAELGEALRTDAEERLGPIVESAVVVADAHDRPAPGLRSGERAARVDVDDDRLGRERMILRDEPRAEQPRLLRAREERVRVVRSRLGVERVERREDERAAREIVRGAQAHVVVDVLERREIEDAPVADREVRLGLEAEVARRPVRELDVRSEVEAARVDDPTRALDRDRDRRAEGLAEEAAADARATGVAARLHDLEPGMIEMGEEHEPGGRVAASRLGDDVAPAIAAMRDPERVELRLDRGAWTLLVIRRGRRRSDRLEESQAARSVGERHGRTRYRAARMLALYDTRRRRRVPFRPRGRTVTLYVCGVTPYDTTHLGHARTFLVFDVLVRHLESTGLRVRYAQNVTDVDESILQRAALRGVDWRALGRAEEGKFLGDMRGLGWRRPDVMPHATREIPAMLRLAEILERRGHAYRAPDGGLYYEVSTFPRFGELSRFSAPKMKRILAQQDDARLDDPRRRAPLDFALWRRVANDPRWPSPYGPGRPGWHLECSAMALRHLGQVDIHGGGDDLEYPHHESEIAQSEGATGRPFVRYWVHVAPIRLGGEKMSKSKRNMVFVRDALERARADGLRLYLLSKHYRKPFDHDEDALRRHDALALELREMALPSSRVRLPREARAALDADLDTPAVVRLLRGYVRSGEAESATVVARHLGLLL